MTILTPGRWHAYGELYVLWLHPNDPLATIYPVITEAEARRRLERQAEANADFNDRLKYAAALLRATR